MLESHNNEDRKTKQHTKSHMVTCIENGIVHSTAD